MSLPFGVSGRRNRPWADEKAVQADGHDCMQESEHVHLNEGDDVLVEQCQVCGRIRYEPDGIRAMAWFNVPRSGNVADQGQSPIIVTVPHTYAYKGGSGDPNKPTVWKFPPPRTEDAP